MALFKKKDAVSEPSQGNHEVLSTGAKTIRWIFSILLILYSCITIFVLVITVMDSLKTQSDLVMNFVGLPKAISFENYAKVMIPAEWAGCSAAPAAVCFSLPWQLMVSHATVSVDMACSQLTS